MIRISCAVLGIALLCAIIAGCGNNSGTTGKGPKPAPTTTTQPSSSGIQQGSR